MEIFFSGQATCAHFEANIFKKDLCSSCGNKISKHSCASSEDIKAALEYSVDKGIIYDFQLLLKIVHN